MNSALYTSAAAVLFPPWVGGLLGGVAVLFLASLITVLWARAFYRPLQRAPQTSPAGPPAAPPNNTTTPAATSNMAYGLTLGSASTAAGSMLKDEATGTADSLLRFVSNIWSQLGFAIIMLTLAILSLFLLQIHPIAISGVYQLIHCYTQPVVEDVILPILNTARVFYSFIYAFVNLVCTISFAWTWLLFRVIVSCTSLDFVKLIAVSLLTSVFQIAVALFTWIATGIFSDGRIELMPALDSLGTTVNSTRPVLDCFCNDLGPLWTLALAIPQLPSLHALIDCAANVPVRLVQIPIDGIINFKLPSVEDTTDELQCTITSYGELWEDLVQLFLEFFYGLYSLLATYLSSVDASTREAVVGATSLSPYEVSTVLDGTEGFTAADNTFVQPQDAHYVHLARLWVSSVENPFSFWSILQELNLVVLYGFDALMRLASTPWSHIFTEPIAAAMGLGNVTVEFVFHPVAAFSSPDGLKYFQAGMLGDRLRTAADAASQLLIFFDRRLPCMVSEPAQVIVSIPDTIWELWWGAVFSWIFPPWTVGEPPPVDCNVDVCAQPPPVGWSFLNVFPDYYYWNGSRIRRSLNLLLEGGECAAYLLGCNTTALNNNSTNATSNCTSAPFACVARGINKVIVESLNTTLSLLFYLPDIARFDPNYHTLRDLPLGELAQAFYDLVACASGWLDSLDENGDMCLTTTVPEGPLGPRDNITVPSTGGVNGLTSSPSRDQWDCRDDGTAYYLNGRYVVVQNTTGSTDALPMYVDQHYPCNASASRQCAVAGTDWIQILGSAPNDNVTLLFSPLPDVPRIIVRVNAPDNTIVLPPYNSSTLLGTYNISTITTSNCTLVGALPTPLTDYWGCRNGQALMIQPYNSSATQRSADTLNLDDANHTAVECNLTRDVRLVCQSGAFTYDGNAVLVRVGSNFATYEVPLNCTSDKEPVDAACFMNQLTLLPTVPATVNVNETFAMEVFYRIPGSSDRLPVPCTNEVPEDYACNALGEAMLGNATLVVNGTGAPLPCVNNTNTQTPPCSSITVQYYGGATAFIVLEGGDVRVYFNNTRQDPLPCLYAEVASSSTASISSVDNPDLPLGPDVDGTSLTPFIAAATIKVRREMQRHATSTVRFTATEVNWLQQQDPTVLLAAGVQPRVLAADATLYRKQTLLCYTSAFVQEGGDFFISLGFTVVTTVRDIFSLPTFVGQPFNVPTFAEARDDFRAAGCDFIGALSTIIPVTLSCSDLKPTISCSNSASCTHNAGCALMDVPLLVADYLVSILELLRDLSLGQAPTDDENVIGTSCDGQTPGNCIVSVMSYVFVKLVRVGTAAVRNVAGFFDCIICGLVKLANPDGICIPTLFLIVDPLCFLLEGLAGNVLRGVLNIIIGVVQCFIYFFTGQWDLLFNAFVTQILGGLVQLGGDVWNLIVGFLLRIPGVKQVVNFFLTVINGACSVLNDIIRFFNGPGIDCPNLPPVTKRSVLKRSLQAAKNLTRSLAAGWLGPGFPADVTSVWPTACNTTIPAYNQTDPATLTETDRYAILYCTLAHLWVGDDALLAADVAGGCDTLMPLLYDADRAFESLSALEQSAVRPCLQGRGVTFSAHALENATWVPHDLTYAPITRIPSTAMDFWFAHSIYSQMLSDRSVPAATLLSSNYRTSWARAGYSVDHLDVLASYRDSMTSAEIEATVADFDTSMYVQGAMNLASSAAAAGQATSAVALMTQKQYDADRITAMIDQVLAPIYGQGVNESLASAVSRQYGDLLEAKSETAAVSMSLAPGILNRLLTSNNTRLLNNAIRGMRDVFLVDIPAALVRMSRYTAPDPTAPGLKRAVEGVFLDLPTSLLQATQGFFILTADLLSGRAAKAQTWLNNETVQSYLQEHAESILPLTTAKSTGPAAVQSADLLSSTAASIWSSVNAWLPAGAPAFHMAALFEQSMNSSSLVTSAAARRMKLSQFGARVALAASAARLGTLGLATAAAVSTGDHTHRYARQVYGAASSSLPCRLAVLNTTTNVTTYPLCDTCLGLDQTLGFTVGAVLALVAHLNVNATREVSFRQTLANYNALANYLQNKSAPALFGDSPELPPRFPARDYDNWRYFGDYTPNKLRFRDLAELATATWNYFVDNLGQTSAGTTVQGLLTASSTAAEGPVVVNSSRRDTGRSFNEVASSALVSVLAQWQPSWLQAIPTRVNASSALGRAGIVTLPDGAGVLRLSSTTTTTTTPFSSLWDIGYAWGRFFFYSAISCDYGAELDGSTKRFSVGEMIAIVLAFSIVISLVLSALLPSSLLTVLGGSGLLFGTLLLMGGWWVAYDWSVLCFPAAPLGFGDDFVNFTAFTLAPRCQGGGFVNEPEYDSSNCGACSNWQNAVWTIPNFATAPDNGGKFGFEDLSYNIVFTLRWLWPAGLDYLRNVGPTLPVVGTVLGSALVQARIARFGDMDFYTLSEVAYSQFFLGNIVTGVLNLVVVIGFFVVPLGLVLGPVLVKLFNTLFGLVTVGSSLGQTGALGLVIAFDHVAASVPDANDGAIAAGSHTAHVQAVEMTLLSNDFALLS